jgi:hypothetical protein
VHKGLEQGTGEEASEYWDGWVDERTANQLGIISKLNVAMSGARYKSHSSNCKEPNHYHYYSIGLRIGLEY